MRKNCFKKSSNTYRKMNPIGWQYAMSGLTMPLNVNLSIYIYNITTYGWQATLPAVFLTSFCNEAEVEKGVLSYVYMNAVCTSSHVCSKEPGVVSATHVTERLLPLQRTYWFVGFVHLKYVRIQVCSVDLSIFKLCR